jgi:uncharacterized protein
MANLGYLYDRGAGVPQEYAKAKEWYQKAAAAGSTQAQQRLQTLSGAPPVPQAESH